MAPASQSIVRFSSQDPTHRAENVLSGKPGKWLSQKTDHNGRIELEIHLSKAVKIAYVNIGNAGSAFVELLVGRSMWSQNESYMSFLPSTTLMLPQDSKTGKNAESVKMLHKGSFCRNTYDQEWDRIQVICRQPFNKTKQFGLQFIDLVPDEKQTNDEDRSQPPSPAQTLSKFKSFLSPSSSTPKPKIPSSSPTAISPQSRSAGLVQAALEGKGKPTPNIKQVTPTRRRNVPTKIRTSPYPVNGSACIQREKTRSRGCAEDIEDEVECFLEGCKFDEMTLSMLEKITYQDLKDRMEKQRGCPLSKSERKIFLKLAEKSVTAVLAKHDMNDEIMDEVDAYEEMPSPGIEVINTFPEYQHCRPTSQQRTNNKNIRKTSYHLVVDEDCIMVPSLKNSDIQKSSFGTSTTVNIDSDFPLGIAGEDRTNYKTTNRTTGVDDTIAKDVVPKSQNIQPSTETIDPFGLPNGLHEEIVQTAVPDLSEDVLCPICYKTFPDFRISIHADLCAQSSFG